MSSFKEIVTKAVIGKAKKTNSNSFTLTPEEIPNTVLGCWVINHSFNGIKGKNGLVNINGSFDVNVWYSYETYLKHLKETKRFANKNNNYILNISDYLTFNNISITIFDKKQVIISKEENPTIHFVIKHPKLVNAINNFNPLVKE